MSKGSTYSPLRYRSVFNFICFFSILHHHYHHHYHLHHHHHLCKRNLSIGLFHFELIQKKMQCERWRANYVRIRISECQTFMSRIVTLRFLHWLFSDKENLHIKNEPFQMQCAISTIFQICKCIHLRNEKSKKK